MKQYIGTKLVTAKPMTRGEYNEYRGWAIPANENPADEGYLVKYSDSYESWSPKWVFESAYLPLEHNSLLKTEKPSISSAMVDDFIAGYQVLTLGEKTTVVRAVLRNGFEIVESSACVSKENYDVALGAKICMEKIQDKVWMLLGFLLQTAVSGVDGRWDAAIEEETTCCGDTCENEPTTKLDFGAAIRAVKRGERIAREGWNGKGQYVELAKNVSYISPDNELVNPDHIAFGNAVLAFVGTSGVQLGWLASQADLLAEDWMIVQ